ncbi:hypothetical protein HZH68_016525 [Vespula germanica]|uniref:Uncharacterized protein n=1 Tax=Vespula germanica TaxID=30212 RepID=A0A834MQ57_VESGE|nr:hypothetical protein HZH68_016525 [Vespula germanica]
MPALILQCKTFQYEFSRGVRGVETGWVTLPSKGRSSTRGFPRWLFLGKQERKDIDGYGDLMAYCSRHPMPPPLPPRSFCDVFANVFRCCCVWVENRKDRK